MRFFGPYQCLVVGDGEILKDIFVKEFDSFSERPVTFALFSFKPIAGSLSHPGHKVIIKRNELV